MIYLKRLLFAAMVISLPIVVCAQPHNNLWLRTTIGLPLGGHFRTDAELHYRRQNILEKGNRTGQQLLSAFRPWLHYQHSKDVRFSLSPVAWFSTYKTLSPQETLYTPPVQEWRISAAAEVQYPLTPHLQMLHRTIGEYRMLQNGQPPVTRVRYRLALRAGLWKHFKVLLYDELLVNAAGVQQLHFFDQNRIGASIEYAFSRHWRFEAGYMRVNRLPLTGTRYIRDHNTVLHLIYMR